MKKWAASLCFCLWATLTIALSTGGTARAQSSNTGFGSLQPGVLFFDTTGDFNSAFGFVALGSNTTGQYNTAVGSQALAQSTTGYYNTAVGALSLIGNGLKSKGVFEGVGSSNTAVGYSTLSVNTADNNTAVGFETLQNNTTGFDNTAHGADALASNTTGAQNAAMGANTLLSNTTGFANTAMGTQALNNNTTGRLNTATGFSALNLNASGSNNTADGFQALFANTANNNTAQGFEALFKNTVGSNNTADGQQALASNTAGIDETAIGGLALTHNTNGNFNTAAGFQALNANSTGARNTGAGVNALLKNTSGQSNSAVGVNAMFNNTIGSNNIALGDSAGSSLTVGNNNIEIGNPGLAAETNAIRIGRQGTQTQTYIAGISGAAVTGTDVVVNASGRLGIVMSSARYKHDVHSMGEASEGLARLRPVAFRYNDDNQGLRQYGLIAEEVEQVYPELVTRGADGKVNSVRYYMLTPLLLNELQKQIKENAQQSELLRRQSAEIRNMAARMALQERKLEAQRLSFEERISDLQRPGQALRAR